MEAAAEDKTDPLSKTTQRYPISLGRPEKAGEGSAREGRRSWLPSCAPLDDAAGDGLG